MIKKDKDINPQTRLAKPTIIPEAKIAYPALRDSGAYIFDVGTLSNFVCRIIATITPYIATASQKITLRQKMHPFQVSPKLDHLNVTLQNLQPAVLH